MPDTDCREAEEAADLLAAVARKRDGAGASGRSSKGKRPRRRQAPKKQAVLDSLMALDASEAEDDEAKPKSKPKKKRPAKKRPVNKSRAASSSAQADPGAAPAAGVTGPAPAAVDGRHSGRRWSRLTAVVAVLTVVALAWLGEDRAPAPPRLATLLLDDEVAVPGRLVHRWISSFPEGEVLPDDPTPARLAAFAEHLADRPAVARVDRVVIDWLPPLDDQPPARVLRVGLRLREPVLPVARPGGRLDWVDGAGVVLPGELAGPDDEPRVVGIDEAHPDALAEVLELWPRLKMALEAARKERDFVYDGRFVTRIHLHAPLDPERPQGERGIVFETTPGTRLIWGRPGESVFGLDVDYKIANLIHTLSCQGSGPDDLDRVAAINVRYDGPFAVAR